MAASSLVSPTSMYTNGPPPPYSDPRRTSDNKAAPPPPIQTAPPHRQSLPSIHEALSSGGPKPMPYASPVSAPLAPSHHQLPYSHSQAPSVPRSYPPPDHTPYQPHLPPSHSRLASPPRPVQPHPNQFTRNDSATSNFPESRHGSLTSLQAAPGPPPNPYAGPRHEPSRYEQDLRAPEQMSNGYTHHSQPPQQGSYSYGPPSGQITPSGHLGPAYSQPRYQTRDGREPIDSWKGREDYKAEPEFRHGLKRHLDVWDFENNLAQINTASRVLMEWSHHYNAIAQEQQRSVNVVPDRMPTLENCKEMIEHQEAILVSLTRMKDMILQQEHAAMVDQRNREQGNKASDYDEEMSLYGEDMKSLGFGASEGKKRRGRAAPPGRCHSCNRAETPEWRRGPDGARTLCNACGLHYAKLTRKNTLKQSQSSNVSSLRPKSMDDTSPRSI